MAQQEPPALTVLAALATPPSRFAAGCGGAQPESHAHTGGAGPALQLSSYGDVNPFEAFFGTAADAAVATPAPSPAPASPLQRHSQDPALLSPPPVESCTLLLSPPPLGASASRTAASVLSPLVSASATAPGEALAPVLTNRATRMRLAAAPRARAALPAATAAPAPFVSRTSQTHGLAACGRPHSPWSRPTGSAARRARAEAARAEAAAALALAAAHVFPPSVAAPPPAKRRAVGPAAAAAAAPPQHDLEDDDRRRMFLDRNRVARPGSPTSGPPSASSR
jgi:hypothetical protein